MRTYPVSTLSLLLFTACFLSASFSAVKGDSCKVNVCQNGGTCVTKAEKDSFICICLDGFTGDTCSEKEIGPCHPNPCKNDGICEPQRGDVFGGYTCKCLKGFEGTHCENKTGLGKPSCYRQQK